MSDRTVNIPLLRKAVEWAEAEAMKPYEIREWDQRQFVITASDADRETWGSAWLTTGHFEKSPECGTCFCIAGYTVAAAADPSSIESIEDSAQDLLGLSWRQADRLFGANNSIEDVRRIAEDIAGERL